jgi:hypothetical protein
MDDDEDGKGDEPKPANPIKPKEADAQNLLNLNKFIWRG